MAGSGNAMTRGGERESAVPGAAEGLLLGYPMKAVAVRPRFCAGRLDHQIKLWTTTVGDLIADELAVGVALRPRYGHRAGGQHFRRHDVIPLPTAARAKPAPHIRQ